MWISCTAFDLFVFVRQIILEDLVLQIHDQALQVVTGDYPVTRVAATIEASDRWVTLNDGRGKVTQVQVKLAWLIVLSSVAWFESVKFQFDICLF